MRVQEIDSLELPELAPYRTMRRQQEHREQGVFVAEGEKVVRRLLESELTVVSLLLPAKWLREYQALIRARPEEIQVYVAPKAALEELTGFSMYQGVLGVGRVPRSPPARALLEPGPQPRLFAAVAGLSNAQNVGVLVRNCVAFGVQALLVSGNSASPFLRRAVRSSMGAIFRLPVIENVDLAPTLALLRSNGVRCVAAHPRSERRTPARAGLASDCCLVFGAEGDGLTPDIIAACDECVAIPMAREVDSLNVGNAAAVFFYEANRQRGRM